MKEIKKNLKGKKVTDYRGKKWNRKLGRFVYT